MAKVAPESELKVQSSGQNTNRPKSALSSITKILSEITDIRIASPHRRPSINNDINIQSVSGLSAGGKSGVSNRKSNLLQTLEVLNPDEKQSNYNGSTRIGYQDSSTLQFHKRVIPVLLIIATVLTGIVIPITIAQFGSVEEPLKLKNGDKKSL